MSLKVEYFPIIINKKEKLIVVDDHVLSLDDDT